MKYCTYCGKEICDDAVICTNCGGLAEPNGIETPSTTLADNQKTEQSTKCNILCILGFVLSFFFGIVGLILSCIGLSQAQKRNEKCQGLAIAGIVISCLAIVAHIILFIMLLPYMIILFFLIIGCIFFI